MAAERARLVLAAACVLAGCAQNGTGVMLTVDGPGLRVDDLELVAQFNGLTISQHARPAAALSLPVDVLAELPDAPTTVTFDVTGRLAGAVVGHGVSDPIVVTVNRVVPGRVSLFSTGGDLGAGDLSGDAGSVDLAAGDAPPADFAPPDLTPPPDLASSDLATLPIIFVGHGEDRVQSQSTVLIHVSPFAGVLTAGDFLLLVAYAEGAVPMTPTGWTYVSSGTATGSTFSIYYKRSVGPTEMDTNLTLSATANIASTVVLGYRNIATTSPLDAYLNPPSTTPGVPGNSNTTISFTAPSITTTRPNDRVVAIYMYQSGAGETWMAPPNNLFQVVVWQELAVYDGPFMTPGATGPETGTASFVLGTDNTIGGAWLGALAAE